MRATVAQLLFCRDPNSPYTYFCQLVLLCILVAGLSACRNPQPEDVPETPELATQPADNETTTTPAESETRPEPIDLVVWLPSFFTQAEEASLTLRAGYNRFEREHDGVEVLVYPKPTNGQADIFTYLENARDAAPSILPDIVVLNSSDLWRAADLDIVQPLTQADLSRFERILPEALEAVRHDEQIFGLPYALNIEHLVYRSELLSTPPSTWEELLGLEASLLFPAGAADSQISDFLVAQYLSAGGTLDNEGNFSSTETLQGLFTFLFNAGAASIIPNSALNLASSDAVWSLFTGSEVEMVYIPASTYWANRRNPSSLSYGLLPTRSGDPVPILRTWSFAIVTQDPERRELAFSVLERLFEPEVQAAWSLAAYRLPSQEESFTLWPEDDDYHDFLQELLAVAAAPPTGLTFLDNLRSLQQIQRNLLNNNITPEDAIQEYTVP